MAWRGKTVSAGFIRFLVSLGESAGLARGAQLDAGSLTEVHLLDPSARVGLQTFERILSFGEALPRPPPLRDALLTLSEACTLEVTSWLNAPSLRHALQNVARYRPLITEADELRLRMRGEHVRIEYVGDTRGHRAAIQAHSLFVMLADVIRGYQPGVDLRMQLTGAPMLKRPLEEHTGGEVLCEQPCNVLSFSSSRLDAPLPCLNRRVAEIATCQLDERLARLEQEASFSRRVALMLPGDCGADTEHDALERLCARLGMSRWTIARRLALEKTTFEQVCAQARLGEARRLLDETSMPVHEIASRTGFRSASSFTRFFRHRTGLTPLVYRAQLDS